MDKNIRFAILSLCLAVMGTNLMACSSDQIYGEDSFQGSSMDYAEGEDPDFDIDSVHAEAAKDLKAETFSTDESLKAELEPLPKSRSAKAVKPKATSSTKKKKTSL